MSKTNLLILLCIAASLLLWLAENPDAVMAQLAFSGENLLKGRAWTLATALFLHADPAHLVGNMLFLFVFGNTLEKELGAGKTLSAFFIGGTLSFLLGVLFYSPETFLIGASAAIFTLAAVAMLVKPLKFSFLFLMPIGLAALIYFIYNVFAVYYGAEGNIAYVSHVIGFLIGVPFGAAWGKNVLRNLLITIALFIVYIVIAYVLIPQLLQAIGLS
ncbi:MAG: rhomboid family intramembrane serine protease [Candidatus Bathyarchaeota archaeon]|nr:rhomboid family intramembrane serine protease [Candidatus Bathyarchaeota archaeon]